MKTTCLVTALVLLSSSARAQSAERSAVEDVRRQMMLELPRMQPPAGVDPLALDRDLSRARHIREAGVGMTLLGSLLLTASSALALGGAVVNASHEAGYGIGCAVGSAFGNRTMPCPPDPNPNPGAPYLQAALFTGLAGAATLAVGIPTLVHGNRLIREAQLRLEPQFAGVSVRF